MRDHLNMPCCPICDNAIEDWEEAAVIAGNGAKALAPATGGGE